MIEDVLVMRRAGEGSTDYNLTSSSPLPRRDASLKNKHNKRELSRVFAHDEAEVTMIAYLLEAADSGKKVIRILIDDTDVLYLYCFSTGSGNGSCTGPVVSRWNVGMVW